MIVILKPNVSEARRDQLISWFKAQNLGVHISQGDYQTVLGLIGDTKSVDMDLIASLDIVDAVRRVSDPFKCCNRKFHPDDTIVDVSGVKIGGGNFAMIAGPCSVESEEQIVGVANDVKKAGAKLLRGGAFKPRTSPYDFQGLQGRGSSSFCRLRRRKPVFRLSPRSWTCAIWTCLKTSIVIQVGARNMQNFDLLKELGKTKKPILLKRGIAATMKELLMSAEYIMASGNEQVILCERGIRTYETYTRNTLDLSAVPMLHELSHLPVVVDPSHATGLARLVTPMALAATAGGADGIMVEVHNDPIHALCDGAQSLTPSQFAELSAKVMKVREAVSQ